MSTVKNFAQIISYIFSPIVMPLYCMAFALSFTYLYTLPLATRLNTLLVIFALTVCLPVALIYILSVVKLIKSTSLIDSKDRTLPYICAIVSYALVLVFFYFINAPGWLLAFVIGGIIAVIIDTLVNLRWKISGHATALGSTLAFILFIQFNGLNAINIEFWIYAVILISGMVASARLVLDRHTLMQILAGYANGLIVSYLTLELIS